MAAPVVKLMLRLPPELHAQLLALAAAHDRSLNGEIVAAVRHWAACFRDNPHGFPVLPPRLAEQSRQGNK